MTFRRLAEKPEAPPEAAAMVAVSEAQTWGELAAGIEQYNRAMREKLARVAEINEQLTEAG